MTWGGAKRCVRVLLLRNPFMYPSSVMIFLHSICIMLGLVTSQYVLGQCYLSLSDPRIGNTCIYELYVGYSFCTHRNPWHWIIPVGVGPFDHQVLGTGRTSKGNDPSAEGGLISVHGWSWFTRAKEANPGWWQVLYQVPRACQSRVWDSQGPYVCLVLCPFSGLLIPIWNGIQVSALGIHSMYWACSWGYALDIQHRASREWGSGWNRTRTGYPPSTDHALSSRDTSTFLESYLMELMKSK